jgi:hypothetical protein
VLQASVKLLADVKRARYAKASMLQRFALADLVAEARLMYISAVIVCRCRKFSHKGVALLVWHEFVNANKPQIRYPRIRRQVMQHDRQAFFHVESDPSELPKRPPCSLLRIQADVLFVLQSFRELVIELFHEFRDTVSHTSMEEQPISQRWISALKLKKG